MSDLANIGLSGVVAFKNALMVSSNNIANASTPYYSRQMIEFGEQGAMGGVSVVDVRRVIDESATQYLQISQSNFSSLDVYLKKIQDFEPLFDNNQTNLSKDIRDSLSALENLNLNAGALTNRSLYFNSLVNLANRFQDLNNEINRESQDVNQSLHDSTVMINNLLETIANINGQIVTSGGQDVSGLLDQRDGQLQTLAKFMNFTTRTDENGLLNVMLSNGMSLVANNQVSTLTTMADPTDPSNLLIGVVNGPNTIPISNLIQSGSLTGLMNFNNTVLSGAQHGLNRLAMAISQSLNAQNQLGIDINGNKGLPIFADINTSTAINSRVNANINNTGSGNLTVTIDDITQLTTSDYQLVIGASNAYTITRLSDQTVVSSGTISSTLPQTISIDGFTTSINSQSFKPGDEYIISPTQNGVDNMLMSITDPSQLALAWPVSVTTITQNLGSTGKVSVSNITDASNASFSTPKQLSPPIQVVFTSPTTYNLVNANTSAIIESAIPYDPTSGGSIFPTPGSYDPGYRVSIAGSLKTGDTFLINFSADSADNRNGRAMAAIYQNGILENGLQTFEQNFVAMNNQISVEGNSAQSDYDVALFLRDQALFRDDQISGVSLEEETMNLSRFQQGYEASAQILQAAKAVLDIIMSIMRR